jgi:hypothetical protein
MTVANGTGDLGSATDGRPVVLVRYRPGITTNAGRTVHLLLMSVSSEKSSATALCGGIHRRAHLRDNPCRGQARRGGRQLPAVGLAGHREPQSGAAEPGARHGSTDHPNPDRDRGDGDPHRSPLPPSGAGTPLRPRAPGAAAGEPYPVALSWPAEVHRVTATLLLPPSVTSRGPLRWVRPPHENSLRLCREIDVLTAVRSARQQREK